MIEGKIWGETESIFGSESVSVHVLKIRKGGYSSRHFHKIKSNYFHVLKGAVLIREWQGQSESALVDGTTLRAGQRASVSPGVWHQFEALEDSEMIEIYIAGLMGPDIVRMGHGGLKCEAEIKAGKKKSEE